MDEAVVLVQIDVDLHAEVPEVPVLRLVYLRIPPFLFWWSLELRARWHQCSFPA